MYNNVNYGDDRNFPAWSQRHQQQQQQLIRQQQQQAQQQVQQQVQQQQQHHNHHRHHHLPQQRTPSRQSVERIWNDTHDDVPDNVTVTASGFRSGSAGTTKSQITPPLDLSEGLAPHRESPLDLSVKPRNKRHADTNEYGELVGRAMHAQEAASMAKRQCMTKYPPGHPSHAIVQEHIAEKQHMAEISSLNKMVQQQQHKQQQQQAQVQQQHARNKFHPGGPPQKYNTPVQISPTAIAQQQFSNIERQHISQQQAARQMQMAMQTLRPPTAQLSPHHGSQQVPIQRRQPSPYDIPHSAPVLPKPINQTESVALKGFFEPTHKVTVNASVSAGPMTRQHQQPPLPHMMSSERTLSHNASRAMANMSAEQKAMEESRQPGAGYPHASMYQRSPGNRMGPMATSPPGPISDIEIMQRQAQYQRQVQQTQNQKQFQREAEILRQKQTQQQPQQQQQKSAAHNTMAAIAQEQHRMNVMIEMQKHSEAAVRKMEGLSPYPGGMIRHPGFPESIRQEKAGMSDIRCMKVGQPVPLPDAHPQHAVLERVQTLNNQGEMYRDRRPQPESRPSHAADVMFSQHGPSSIRNVPGSVRFEQGMPRYRLSEHGEKHHLTPGMPQGEGTPMHPSVIQRPQGYIPPRIVRRESTDTAASRRPPNERERQYHLQTGVPVDFNSEQMSIRGGRSQYAASSKDMLSGRDVLRIQQRAAEQRNNDTQISYKHHSKVMDVGGGPDNPIYAERRKSLPDINNAHPHQRERDIERERERERGGHSSERVRYPSSSSGREVAGPSGRSSSKESITSPVPRTASVLNTATSPGRSITKGTSGMGKAPQEVDVLSQFLMRELRKTDDDDVGNPFANRSLLLEFDRSANSSPVRVASKPTHTDTDSKASVQAVIKKDKCVVKAPSANLKDTKEAAESVNTSKADSSYTLPLQIAIPGHKTSAQAAPPAATERSSVIANAIPKTETPPPAAATPNPPKFMSRKQMILNAFRHDEDLNKNTSVDIDKDEKVPIEIPKYASMKQEKDSSHFCPPSPKMPILSPQERSRTTPNGSQAQTEQLPPNLEDSSTSSGQGGTGEGKDKGKMESLEEHLHRMISNALNKDDSDVVEAVCRNFQNHGNRIFVSRQTSLTRNIPVANVAPIVHGKSIENSEEPDSDKVECGERKVESEMEDEDAKMAEVVTRSIFGERLGQRTEILPKTEQNTNEDLAEENDGEKTETECGEHEETNKEAVKDESLFDENSNSMRMSPGLKKLMLYRHRDLSEIPSPALSDSMSALEISHDVNDNLTPSGSDSNRNKTSKRSNRNVFGDLSEIVAQTCNQSRSSTAPEVVRGVSGPQQTGLDHQKGTCWTGYQADEETREASVTGLSTGYDGDDEQGRDVITPKRAISNTKQQADRLIKKARHRRSSRTTSIEGSVRSRHALQRPRHAQKGFVDFTPRVLPRRTRLSRSSSQSPRKRNLSGLEHPRSRRPSAQSSSPSKSPKKTRRRRASSLDRETNSKANKVSKHKQGGFHSDNEIETDSPNKGGNLDNSAWHNEDESTDEEYFQNFQNFNKKGDEELSPKKGPTTNTLVKKRKAFHFKQKYIFQRKRKVNKNKNKAFRPEEANAEGGGQLDNIYSFHEEGQDLRPLHYASADLGPHSNIPVPSELKRVAVNKDTGETMLHKATRLGFEEVVLYILATGSVDVNARDNAGYTALHECAVRGRVEIGKHLLTYGADVNVCSTDGIRPIHDAVENDRLEVLRLLLAFGADPTLSTYAGRSLMKIARTERMRKFIEDYFCDLNGYQSVLDETPWPFKNSCTVLEPETGSGCPIFENLPSDPEDETQEMFVTAAKPLFPVRRLAVEPGKRVEDYLLLDDLVNSYAVNRLDCESIEEQYRHQIKHIPNKTLTQANTDSIFWEYFVNKQPDDATQAIRMVDSTTVIAKLEKFHASSARRPK